MDDAVSGLEVHFKPLYHSAKGSDAAILTIIPFTQQSGHPPDTNRKIKVFVNRKFTDQLITSSSDPTIPKRELGEC